MKPSALRRQNLRLLIDQQYGGNTGRFADYMGKKRPTIYRLFSDAESSRDIGEDLAREIERAHKLSTHWLDIDHSSELPGGPLMASENTEVAQRSGSRLPLISWVAASAPREANDPYAPGNAEAWIDFDGEASSSAFCLRVRGDSMMRPDGSEPSFPDGCIIGIEPRRRPKSREFAVFRFNDADEATFKQYVTDGPLKMLKPLNPTYPNIVLGPDAQLVGTVFEKRIITSY